jgi:GT2 family glycosyltransferase/tetratricopeptide (TPR) repeat protein
MPSSLKRRKPSVISLADRARDARQWELAAQLYRKALDRNPQNPPILVQYGHALKESGHLAQAESVYRSAIAYEPGNADPHLQLGHVLKLQGKTEEAQAAYLQAFALEPSLPDPVHELSGLGWSAEQMAELKETTTEQDWSTECDKPHPATPTTGSWSAVTDAEIHCLKKPSFGDEVALFAAYSPNGQLKPHVPHYLVSLARQNIRVTLIVNADRPSDAANINLISEVDGVFVRQAEGYDFSAWAHLLRLHPELFNAKILYMLNDSLIGPTNDAAFGELLIRLRNSPADFIGLTENFDRGWHIQSYFVALKHRALSSIAFHKLVDGIVSYKDKEDVINEFEVRFASTLKAAGLKCEPMFPATDALDPTIYNWKRLLQSGFPFLKLKTIRDFYDGVDISDWRQLLGAQGYDVSLAERSLAEAGASSTVATGSPLDAKLQLRQEASLELRAFFEERKRLCLPNAEHPAVSILLVLFNEAELTFRCLVALIETIDMPAEVIIVDNASSDDTGRLLGRLDGARIFRNRENYHFLRAVNQGSADARGAALLLLNNDAKLMPGALQSALETLHSAPDIGAVGAKLILPDGRLQEAGSIIWDEGTCEGYGRGKDPDAPEYQFRREVDYCSGAFLLIRRDLFEKLGRFDDAFALAYYEETDFCMRLRQAGYRIIYDPRVVVLHFEYGSASSLEQAQVLMRRNQMLFLDRHWRALAKHHLPPKSSTLVARTPDRRHPRLLVIEDLVPFSSHGAGFPRTSRILKALYKAGFFITYYPVNQPEAAWQEVYAAFPIEIEFMLGHGRATLGELLEARAGYYDVIFVCRPTNMEFFAKHFDDHPDRYRGVSVIYDAEALFSSREAMRLALIGTPMTVAAKEIQLRKEVDLVRVADAVIAVSANEASVFEAAGHGNVHVVGHALEPAPIEADFADRKDFLFVGPLYDDYVPNADALFWFIEEVMPHLDRLLDASYRVHVCGATGAERLRDLVNPRIVVLGRVEDLTEYYRRARVFVAPTRFAAGIPHKIHETAARGLPAVATSLLATQLGWEDGDELLVADTPEDFAAQCARLYTDRALWHGLRETALARVMVDCDPAAFAESLAAVLRSVGIHSTTTGSFAGIRRVSEQIAAATA